MLRNTRPAFAVVLARIQNYLRRLKRLCPKSPLSQFNPQNLSGEPLG